MLAMPKKATKPIMSVKVVRMTPPALAGSMLLRVRNTGSMTPSPDPNMRFSTIALAKAVDTSGSWNHK